MFIRVDRRVNLLLAAALCVTALPLQRALADRPITYPDARKADQVDDLHGVKVADPYRWMEDLDSPELKKWIDAENKVTFAFLGGIPARERIKARLTRLWDYERFGIPFKQGTRYFVSRNNGLQNQSVYYTMDALDAPMRELLDPNKLSDDGTVALSGMSISEDGNLMAYGLAASGSDWVEYKVRDVRTGEDLSDHVKWVKFSGASWTLDGKGFFYSRYDEPKGKELSGVNYFQKLYYHHLGTPQSQDVLVYDRSDQKEWGFGGYVTEDGKYLIISVWQGTERKNRIYYRELHPASKAAAVKNGLKAGDYVLGDTVKLLDDFDAQYDLLGNDGTVFWFRTDLEAPRGRVIAVDTGKPGRGDWKELIAQSDDTLQGVGVVGDQFIAEYLHDAHSKVKVFDLAGKFVRDIDLPGIGSAGGFGGRRRQFQSNRSETETFYSYTSFATPPTIYRYDTTTGKSTVFKQAKVDFDPSLYEVKQVFYKSKDGTRVPMFITHKKGLALDGSNPTLLYGYGGFDVSLTPSFSVSNLVWMEMGGVYAVPNLRGGGEYGKDWHNAGRKLNKQNVFDDFIAAAEWLIASKYTRSDKLAIFGGSNGGLLVGACMTQRPELFGAALPAVGVLDMLRFHKFTIGWGWTSDYGCADNAEEFKALYAYSPLHNVKPGVSYPPTLITTADHDDRVVPAHSFKFAAALQAAQSGPNPILIRVETKAGHGAGKPTTKQIEERADIFGFLVRTLKMNADVSMESQGKS